jgi:solute carrier family 35, member E3
MLAAAVAAARGADPAVAAAVALNVVCSVSLIAVNKVIFSVLGFRFVIFLSAVHFAAGAALLRALAAVVPAFAAAATAAAPPPPARMLRLAAAGATSIVATNFSLRFNAMGTYQILKTAVLPAVMALSFVQRRGTPGRTAIACAGGIVAGSCMAVVSDVSFSAAGVAIGVTGVLLTAQYQIWGGSEQRDLGLTPTQVMAASALPQAALALAASVALESSLLTGGGGGGGSGTGGDDLFTYAWGPSAVAYIAVSAAFAVGLNWSSFAILGRTSPTTMQVLNQVKTIAIVAADFVMFPKDGITAGRAAVFFAGIALVIGAATWYGVAGAGAPAQAGGGGGGTAASPAVPNADKAPAGPEDGASSSTTGGNVGGADATTASVSVVVDGGDDGGVDVDDVPLLGGGGAAGGASGAAPPGGPAPRGKAY